MVAEGVGNEAVLVFLREAGCNEAQGYLFVRSLEVDVFTAWYVGRIVAQAQQLFPYGAGVNAWG